jgi:hypothetical protein
MTIERRLARIERELGIYQDRRPFVLVVSAGPHKGDPQYEARLRRRIEEAIRQHPNEKFRLILA